MKSLERSVAMRGRPGFGWLTYFAVLLLVGLVLVSAPAAQAITPPDTLRNIRFGDGGTYERAVIDLGYTGTPGEVAPDYTSSYRNGDWILRVKLPTVEATARTGRGSARPSGATTWYAPRAPPTACSWTSTLRVRQSP